MGTTDRQGRPRWVTAYIIILILSIIIWLGILGQLSGMFSLITTNSRIAYDVVTAIVMIIAAAVSVVGLWLMARWGLIAAIIDNILGIVWAVVNITHGAIGRDWILLVFFAFMIFWLYRNRTLFTA